jgi:serine/threonine-protein phosphatase 2A regulatory subunit A
MKSTENPDSLSVGALIEDLKSSEAKSRLNAIKNLHILSSALGKERTRTELLPFITDLIEDEEDDNLIELAKILSGFLELVGGKAYVLKLIKIFETLLSFDEGPVQLEVLFP